MCIIGFLVSLALVFFYQPTEPRKSPCPRGRRMSRRSLTPSVSFGGKERERRGREREGEGERRERERREGGRERVRGREGEGRGKERGSVREREGDGERRDRVHLPLLLLEFQ